MMKTENKNAIQLLIWIFFIVIIFVMFKITNKTEKKEEKEENTPVFVNYKDMEINLLNSGYDYKYTITSDTQKEIYEGTMCNDIDIGYKETIDSITKYKIKNGKITKVLLDNEEEIPSIYDDSEDFLNLNTLFTNLKEYPYNIEKSDNERIISYKKDGYQVLVKTNLEYITNITITTTTNNYNLEFTNVGKCVKIDSNK